MIDMAGEIRIGPIRYTVRKVENLHDGNEKLDGHILYGPCEILLDANLGSQTGRHVLWHEILHAILTQSGHPEQDEKVIDALAYGIVGVLQDNRWLCK